MCTLQRDRTDRQKDTLRCLDCRNLNRPDVPDDFYCSNLRRCRATNRLHWIGDPAEQYSSFTFTREDLRQ